MVRKSSRSTAPSVKKEDHCADEKDINQNENKIQMTLIPFHGFTADEVLSFRAKLLHWYDHNKRDLPWRKTDHLDINKRAYATWVSEIMLQQTQVATVVSYYNKWMKKWPTLEALAASNIEEVNEAWSGLGYYSRGRRLLEGAQKVASEFGGQMPRTSHDLEKKLPGVGRYTAAAIASIALGEVTGLVDGNVVRVFSRLRAIGANITQADVMETFWQLAHQTCDPDRPGDLNQSLMELGARVCTPKQPQCGQCPVRDLCKAHAMSERDKVQNTERICSAAVKTENAQTLLDIECLVPDCKLCLPLDAPWDPKLSVLNFPRKPKKADAKQEEHNVFVLHTEQDKASDTRFLICQRPPKGLLAGLWEFPSCVNQDSGTAVPSKISTLCGLKEGTLRGASRLGEVGHKFSHIHHLYMVWKATVGPQTVESIVDFDGQPVRWVSETELQEAAVSTGMRKVFTEFKKSTDAVNKKRKSSASDVVIKDPKRKQASIADFFKKK